MRRFFTAGGKRRVVIDYAVTVALAIGLAVLIQAFIVKPYMIPSTSMAETLVPGQRVLVDRVVYHYRDVHRGDIVVFHKPVGAEEVLIKRVVGLPGDTLSLEDGRVYVNGQPLREPYVRVVGGMSEPTTPGQGLGGPAIGWSLADPYTVPAGHYFVMGDNRTDSGDSRYFGTVPQENVIGRAVFSYWPPRRLGTL